MTEEHDPARTARVLWRDGPKPATRTRLSADTIVASAIAVADAEGLAGVSMQRIAEVLGYTAMGLYRHVANKATLVAAMTDTAYGAAPAPRRADGWRAEIESWATELWRVYQAHPWLVEVPTRSAPIGPNELAWFEALARPLAELDAAGLDVIGVATFLSSAVRDLARIALELDADQTAHAEVLAEHLDGKRFPTLSRLFGHAGPADDTADLGPALQHGLHLLLDGIELRLPTGKEPENHD
ncbi:TetR/AcrR family transcriptional regulator [Amycolatopsis samaneae]|uniref:TetR/AcrR family transcriptional regulator n=1 Tax=Amycolatopsis samaneae TaxID=664691 RepID=A0ABW5GAB2_9PSEU